MSEADTDQVAGGTALEAIAERLERIEGALLSLVDAVNALAGSVPSRAVAPAASGSASTATPAPAPGPAPAPDPGGPPLIDVAPPQRQATQAPPPRAPARPVTAHPAEASVFDPYADRDDLILPPADADFKQVLTRVFEAILMESAEDTWALMAKLTHSSQLIGPRSLDHFKAFSWHKARRTAHEYLDEARNPGSYYIEYTEPRTLADDTQRVKVFIRKPDGRLPAPIVFARDPKKGGAWRVAQISL